MKPLLILLVAILGLLPGQAPAAEAASNPNILFLIADDASPHFGAYGCTWVKTPNIDRLAKKGLTFDNVYTPTAKCAPSRASILTGRYPWQLEAAANHQTFFPAKYKTFSEAMQEAGILVGCQGKVWGPGIARTSDDKPRTFGMTQIGSRKKGTDVGAGFRDFLAARPQAKPFFFWYGSKDPHRPYQAGAGLAAGKKLSDIDRVPTIWPDNDTVRGDMLDYAVAVEAFDTQVGAFLKALAESGQEENTLVIVTSDHGMPFPRSKGHNYDIANRVPLIASWPKGIAKPGRRVADLVNFIDLAPTFLELQGVEGVKSGMSPITGASFTDLLRGKPARERPFVITGRERNDVYARPGTEAGLGYPIRAIREGKYLYLHNFKPDRWPCGNPELGLKDTDAGPTKKLLEESGAKDRFWQLAFGKRPGNELFDLDHDPDCVKNLADVVEHRERVAAMREELFKQLKLQSDPRILGKGDVFDDYPTTKKKE